MKKTTITLIILINWTLCFSQVEKIILHQVVGDTISLKEKIDYLLFPEIADTNFNYGLVRYINTSYYIISYFKSDSLIRQIDSTDIYNYHKNIEKLYAYYSNKTQSDNSSETSYVILTDSVNKSQKLNTNYISPEMRKKIEYDANRYQRLNGEAQNQGLKGQDRQNYINTGGYGELKFKKKK